MAEKFEFELVVKNNSLETALKKSVVASEELEKNLKDVVGVLNKPGIGLPFKSALDQSSISANKFKASIIPAFANAKTKAEGVSTSLLSVDRSFQDAGKAAAGLGTQITSALSATLFNPLVLGLAAIAALVTSLKEAATASIDFKRAQVQIETILPKNQKLTAELIKQLEQLSVQYGTSATTQAKAYYEIISAGVSDAADGAKLLARANELATGGVAETGQTIDLLTTIYNVYGKEVATAAEASDSLFKTVQLGKTTIAELSADLGQALPIAKSFGVSLDEVGAILAQLTNSGISTSESVTLLNAVLSAIARNGDKLGAGFNSTAVQTEGLGIVLERLRERTNGSNDALFALLGRQEAVRAVQSLTAKGLSGYNEVLAEYSTKAGVAAEASKKIIDEDIGKQFSILGSNIAGAARSFVDLFIPAALGATKALNNFFSGGQVTSTQELSRGLEINRKKLADLESAYSTGRISADAYKATLSKINIEIASLSNGAETATSPLTLLSTGLDKEAANIKAQILEIKSGFNLLGQGPLQATLEVINLEKKLQAVNARLNELKATGVAPAAPNKTVRSEDVLKEEEKLQLELQALRIKFSTEEKTFNDQLYLAKQEQAIIRGEEITAQVYDQKIREAQAVYDAKVLENSLIKDAENQKLANQQAALVKEQAQKSAHNSKTITNEKNFKAGQVALETSFQNSRNTLIGQGFTLAATLAKDGSKTQFLIQKAAALAEIALGDGKARALIPAQTALIPYPGNLAAAAQLNAYVTAQTALGAAIVGASAIKGFAEGGIIGATTGGDNRIASVRDGEMVLNANQQKKLFDMINNGGSGGDVVVNIDGREVARAVRNQIQGGFVLA